MMLASTSTKGAHLPTPSATLLQQGSNADVRKSPLNSTRLQQQGLGL